MKRNNYFKLEKELVAGFVFLFFFTSGLMVNAQEINDLIEKNHKVYVPKGTGPFPVVIIIPGCSGVSLQGLKTDTGRPGNEDDKLFRRHWPIKAAILQEAGYLVLIVDYLAAEKVINTCNGEIPYQKVSKYITQSILFAKTIDKVDSTRINIIGASYGGTSLLTWLTNLTIVPRGIRSIITIYPGCGMLSNVWSSSLPLFMLLGEVDDIAPPEFCSELIKKLPGNTNVKVKTYPSARHGFDLTEGPAVLSIGNGKTVGKNEQAGKDAWKEILSFLKDKN